MKDGSKLDAERVFTEAQGARPCPCSVKCQMHMKSRRESRSASTSGDQHTVQERTNNQINNQIYKIKYLASEYAQLREGKTKFGKYSLSDAGGSTERTAPGYYDVGSIIILRLRKAVK